MGASTKGMIEDEGVSLSFLFSFLFSLTMSVRLLNIRYMIQQPPTYWGIPQPDLLTQLNAKKEGLSS